MQTLEQKSIRPPFFILIKKGGTNVDIKEIKKALMIKGIRISKHTQERLDKRGYTKRDLISCIMSGEIIEHQAIQGKPSVLIQGVDTDGLPIVVSIGYDKDNGYKIITVMPPIHKERFKIVI